MTLTPEEKRAEYQWVRQIGLEILEEISWEGVAETYDGCIVEPDGTCPHGFRSPMMILGII